MKLKEFLKKSLDILESHLDNLAIVDKRAFIQNMYIIDISIDKDLKNIYFFNEDSVVSASSNLETIISGKKIYLRDLFERLIELVQSDSSILDYTLLNSRTDNISHIGIVSTKSGYYGGAFCGNVLSDFDDDNNNYYKLVFIY